MVDFSKFAEEVIGHHPKDWEMDRNVKKSFWKGVDKWVKDGNKFFELMDPMPDAFQLWEYIEKYRPTILSATGHTRHAEIEKRNWVHTHLGPSVPVILTVAAADKANYISHDKCVLIDDRERAIAPWRDRGGIGILHTSALDTIEQLKALGL
jgi:hypothetical protein